MIYKVLHKKTKDCATGTHKMHWLNSCVPKG